MEQHFAHEEGVLFPRFEQATGHAMGPTRIMRSEHTQMRSLFESLGDAIQAKDGDECMGLAETLLILMSQHNVKEEQVLYPMADEVLHEAAPEILREMGVSENE